MAKIRNRIALKVGRQSNIDAELVSFHGMSESKEHVAVIFKQADNTQVIPRVRIHSECLTGDVFGSSRCDCGEQLNESIELFGKEGGIILYLRQEGRGIGLYNKIDAYELQSQGLSTYEANRALGFDADMRHFMDAVNMLKALKIQHIRLVTNNPRKINALKEAGIVVENIVNTQAYIKSDNKLYLKAKVDEGKHLLDLSK